MCPVQLNVLQLSSCRQLAWAKKKGNEMECFGRNTKVRSSSHHDFPIIPLKSLISLYLSSSLISSHYQSYIICKPILTSHDIIYIYIYIHTHCYTLYYTVSILYHILSTVYLSPIWYMSRWSFFLTQLDIPMTSDSLDWRQFHCSSLGRSLRPAGIGPGNTAGLEKRWINKQWIHKGN